MTDPESPSDEAPALKVEKRRYLLPFTHESIHMELGRSFRRMYELRLKATTVGLTRHEKSRTEIPPTQEEIDEYHRLQKLLEEVEASPMWMHGYDGGYLQEPRPKVEIEWAETEDEFEARVNEAYALFMKDPIAHLSTPATFRGKESQ